MVVVGGDKTTDVIYRDTKPGETIKLDATGTSDPDGDQLSFDWWVYETAGTYTKKLPIRNAKSRIAELTIPLDAAGKTIHAVLTVRDDGQPALTRYRRVVLSSAN